MLISQVKSRLTIGGPNVGLMNNMAPASSNEPPVLDWRKVIHKGVRTSNGAPVGNIGAEEQDYIVILGPRSRQYRVPKSSVNNFDGSEVRLSISIEDLINYKH